VGLVVEPEPDPEGEAILKRVGERIDEMRARGEQPTREALGFTNSEWRAYDAAVERTLRPPVRAPEGVAEALRLLERLGLLSRIPAGEASAFQVHRWTAAALERETAPELVREAHRRAARFWRWRVDRVPQSRQADIDQFLEARHHHHAAGDVEQAVAVTEWICSQLDTWGAYGREEQLCREVLEWVPDRSREAASFLHQLGIVAQKRGSYEEALEWYRKSLAINEELGNRVGMANSFGQIGVLLTETGHPREGVSWNLRSLALRLEIGVPEVRIDLHWLGRQREALGDAQFQEALREHLDPDAVVRVLQLLEGVERQE
jgi:tetratricopeptide (TPR) repeat protein